MNIFKINNLKNLQTIKKALFLFFLFVTIFNFWIVAVYAEGNAESSGSGLVLLEDFGGLTKDISNELKAGNSSKALAAYIDMIVKISFGFGSIAAVALIVYQGIQYIISLGVEQKLNAKNGLVRALGALAILFTSFILFNQINPELLKVRFDPIVVDLEVMAEQSKSGGGEVDRKYTEEEIKKIEDWYRKKVEENLKKGLVPVYAGSSMSWCKSKLISREGEPGSCMLRTRSPLGTSKEYVFFKSKIDVDSDYEKQKWKIIVFSNLEMCNQIYLAMLSQKIEELKMCRPEDKTDHSRNPNVPHVLEHRIRQ